MTQPVSDALLRDVRQRADEIAALRESLASITRDRDMMIRSLFGYAVPRAEIAAASGVKAARLYQIIDQPLPDEYFALLTENFEPDYGTESDCDAATGSLTVYTILVTTTVDGATIVPGTYVVESHGKHSHVYMTAASEAANRVNALNDAYAASEDAEND
jgi:hypothetical protein